MRRGNMRLGKEPALLLFLGFLLILLAIHLPGVRALDTRCVQHFYRSGGPVVTAFLQGLSQVGGRDVLLIWLPLLLAALYRLERGRALRFFLPAMLGSMVLEALCKPLVHRARPALGPGQPHFDSFPSGHVLAATILAGVLLILLLPRCRHAWQRGLLWTAAVLWPVLMAISRVYLGRHHPTDTLGSMLLGSAWVCLCASRWAGAEKNGGPTPN